MKPLLLLPVFFAVSSFASARTIPLIKGGALPIPDQAIVNAEGITFVRPGEPSAFTLKWKDVDLKRLAKQDTEIELSRQKALLTGDKTVLGPEAPKPNPYTEFLSLPVRVTFRPKETHQSRTDYNSVTNTVPAIDPNTGAPMGSSGITLDRNGNRIVSVQPIIITNGIVGNGQPFVSTPLGQAVTSSSTTRSDTTTNLTRPPMDTTASAFLELISDDTKPSTGSLVRELREHPEVFTNLISGLRELQSSVPEDPSPAKAIQALQMISKNGSLSVDAQRLLGKFVQHAQVRSENR